MILYNGLYRTNDTHPLQQVCDKYRTVTDPRQLDEGPGVLVLHGGEDISPSIYHQKPGKWTSGGPQPSKRDREEMELAKGAIDRGILIFGICRGAQLMCALSGGKLIQHCRNHAGQSHFIIDNEGLLNHTSSLHHQMMYPWDVPHELIAWSAGISPQFFGENDEELEIPVKDIDGDPIEPEIVYFPTTHALCVQGHPEYLGENDPFVLYCNELVKKYVK